MGKIPILIVDDEEVDRYLLKRFFKETQLNVHIFEKENGKEAIDFFENYENNLELYPNKFPPVLIFLDINMPLMNGHEFLSLFDSLRKGSKFKKCVVMMFSSSDLDQDRDKIMSYDFVKDYVVKGTFTAEALKDKVVSVVEDLDLSS